MTFIDNHLRIGKAYFMRHKSKVFFIVFRNWKEIVENETGMRVKNLWFDNDREYEYFEVKKFCYENDLN